MLADTNERPDIHEQYDVACGQSGSRNVVGAAGMAQLPDDGVQPSGSLRTGMALLRLHSEFCGAAKPQRVSPAGMAAMAEQMKRDDEKARASAQRRGEAFKEPGAVGPRVRAMADAWYSNELRLLAQSLKTRPTVWAQLLPWAQDKGIPEDQVAQALFHWLDPVCGHCGGHGLHKAKDAPALSAKQCRACNGTGTKAIPEGGGRVLSYISTCTSQARTSIGKRLRATRE